MAEPMTLVAWFQEFAADGFAFLFSLIMVGTYYIYLRRQASRDPTYSIHTVNALARRAWTNSIMTTPGKELVAVQSMRNFIMVSIMMASTAAMLIIGTLTLSGHAEDITRSWHVMGMFGSHSPGLWIFKVMCLLVDFIVAFFAYAMSMRLATHCLFMFNIPPDVYRDHPELSPESVANRLIQSGNMIAIGMRSFIFAIPLVFWLFGPVFLLLSTIGLVIILNRLDRHEAASSRIHRAPTVQPRPDELTERPDSERNLAYLRSKTA